MGLWNKVKGMFIEEVEEEVDEPTRQLEKIKDKSTVAKKIETPREEKKEEKEELILDSGTIEDNEPQEEEVSEETKEFDRPLNIEKRIQNDYSFPMNFDEKDFEVDERKERNYSYTPEEEEVISVYEEEKVEEPVKEEEPVLYHERRVDREVKYEVEEPVKVEPYELNGQKEKKQGFQRSPIISPVYGILDKNYRKEEIVSKREIRLTTNNKKADLDLVREKAYGELANDITDSINEKLDKIKEEVKEEPKEETKEEKDNLLYDLSENAQPSVSKITVGDAEEYFEDLGLEYNVDYKVEKEEPKEEKEDKEDEIEIIDNKEVEEEKPIKKVEPVKNDDDETDDELFNLIDEMYS